MAYQNEAQDTLQQRSLEVNTIVTFACPYKNSFVTRLRLSRPKKKSPVFHVRELGTYMWAVHEFM
jgi:hypothetical protein